jgi:hypothetical protein
VLKIDQHKMHSLLSNAHMTETPCIYCSMAPISTALLQQRHAQRPAAAQIASTSATALLPSFFSGHGSAAAQHQPAPAMVEQHNKQQQCNNDSWLDASGRLVQIAKDVQRGTLLLQHAVY